MELQTLLFFYSCAQPEYYKDATHFRSVVGSENKYWLEIPDAKLSYTGTYSVVASNCHGQTKAIISLQIFAKGEQLSFDLKKFHLKILKIKCR